MAPTDPTTVILPLRLGLASRFEKSNFPLASFKGISGIIDDGSMLLSATLEEMERISDLGLDLSSNPMFLQNTGLKYADLTARQEELENIPKSLNPIKYFRNYRAARMFYAAALSLRDQTRETSSSMQRKLKEVRVGVVSSTELQTVDRDDTPSSDASVEAIAIQLPGTLTPRAQQTVINAANTIFKHATDPFVDNPTVRQLSDDDSVVSLVDTASLLTQNTSLGDSGETEPLLVPNSPSYHFHFEFANSTVAMGSSIRGMTTNHGSMNVSAD